MKDSREFEVAVQRVHERMKRAGWTIGPLAIAAVLECVAQDGDAVFGDKAALVVANNRLRRLANRMAMNWIEQLEFTAHREPELWDTVCEHVVQAFGEERLQNILRGRVAAK